MDISISKRSSGGYKVGIGGESYHISNAEYVTGKDTVQLLVPSGSINFNPGAILVENWVVDGGGNFATPEQVASALDSIGIGAKGFNIAAKFATGKISFAAQPAAANTVTIDDGANTPVIFEFAGVKAAGAVAFAAAETPGNPEDGDIITFDSTGDNETVFEFDDGAKAAGAIEFTDGTIPAKPNNGERIIFAQGTEHEKEFIFLTTPAAATGLVEVQIGANANAAMAAFITAFNIAVDEFTAVAADPADNTCVINADAVGVEFNVGIKALGYNFAVTALTGGLDPGEAITEGNIPVVIGADEDETMVNFIAAFNAAMSGWTAYPSSTPDHQCSILADEIGADFNVTITKDGTNITVTSTTGGADPDITAGRTEVVIGTNLAVTCDNLAAAINASRLEGDLTIAAKEFAAYVSLMNLTLGTVGNEALAKSGDNITVSGMAGGAAEINISTLIAALTPA